MVAHSKKGSVEKFCSVAVDRLSEMLSMFSNILA